ncbi:hypothetical protein QTI66_16495 [Variovorax sp. J22R133]|uniref:hypothetical protein n=1 Tax=Variovorax brevis TaxID=3053503 RepID=UPI0025779CF9|nr:hypothetical protein [Variovorax sp. J22R133]MDM0113760.1 hypothetical protein [Variovorax sp. J22R133]
MNDITEFPSQRESEANAENSASPRTDEQEGVDTVWDTPSDVANYGRSYAKDAMNSVRKMIDAWKKK